ncbi:MAG: glycosyltransferase family 2 protein [Pegethrix bostrychoides GSE-TBD4-15B]|jgi:1,2-diacylglycerol 3-beta-glucosyltransferase|uniref:Beta-monoglucosyldiacylglycerol synthase n=1 Tax=Pegethrix bostrychoides GSE-TBD4-15B TaxID=2839662 RepID=A0A951PET0_9CYAN|nr:glycosyltransferase family 2 protein [Pegethrix bostrychoides GSE-TBD4-15B]
MQGNSWQDEEAYGELEPINSLLSELSDSLTDLEQNLESNISRFSAGFRGRRRKAALGLAVIWSSVLGLHLFAYGSWLVMVLTGVMGLHALRVLAASPAPLSGSLPGSLSGDDPAAYYPYVSILVSAKNEEFVIGKLVEDLCNLDYPRSRYDLWIIDDNSSDCTPILLEKLAQDYQNLQIVRRTPDASGGKSGALNQVWMQTEAEIVAVFDADATVPQDLLRRVLPLFERQQVGAVQVRKSISNGLTNFWTRGQVAEMAFDSYVQQQRIAMGGIGELRGNGQFVRRLALERCGGWNEETITDDLDLTIRLQLDRWDIDLLMMPAVAEEGVTNAVGLWHQRNRWAEGGYQRYLDYWRLIAQNKLGTTKTVDLVMFLMTQYLLPTAAVPDFLMALIRSRPPVLMPVTSLALVFSFISMFSGLRQIRRSADPSKRLTAVPHSLTAIAQLSAQTGLGALYMLHWLPVMASTTARMAIRPKQLKWVKTVHHGSADAAS